jgi:hypothetical protein
LQLRWIFRDVRLVPLRISNGRADFDGAIDGILARRGEPVELGEARLQFLQKTSFAISRFHSDIHRRSEAQAVILDAPTRRTA